MVNIRKYTLFGILFKYNFRTKIYITTKVNSLGLTRDYTLLKGGID